MLTRRERPVLIFNLLYIPFFTVMALRGNNYEFLLYVAVILIIGALIIWNQSKVRFDLPILWGLSIWGLLHMAGGNVRVGEGVLYGAQLLPLFPEHNILRYDQFVHAFGFAVATLIAHHLLRPYLRPDAGRPAMLLVLVVLMGSGFGALNEIVEFIAVLTMPETGVGGYENTLWDLVFNLIGGLFAAAWLAIRGRKHSMDTRIDKQRE